MNKTNVMVPYRWMAPESMEDHTFTVEVSRLFPAA